MKENHRGAQMIHLVVITPSLNDLISVGRTSMWKQLVLATQVSNEDGNNNVHPRPRVLP